VVVDVVGGSRWCCGGGCGATVSNRGRYTIFLLFSSIFCSSFAFPFLSFLTPPVFSFLFCFPFPFLSSFLSMLSHVSFCSPFFSPSISLFLYVFLRSPLYNLTRLPLQLLSLPLYLEDGKGGERATILVQSWCRGRGGYGGLPLEPPAGNGSPGFFIIVVSHDGVWVVSGFWVFRREKQTL